MSGSLAKALAHPLRVRILVELNERPMSAPQFAAAFGGPVRNVLRHFRRLEELGCIEQAGTRHRSGRRGGAECVFRAVKRSHVDRSSWEALPDGECAAPTGATFTTYVERVAEAMGAGTIDAREDRMLQWMGLILDRRAWEETIADVDALFLESLQLPVGAAARLLETSGDPIPVTVGLACFESPLPEGLALPSVSPLPAPVRTGLPGAEGVVSERLAKALANPLRMRILAELNRRPMSPTQFANEVGGTTPQNAARHFRRLEHLGCIELVESRRGGRRRGGVEHFFRAVQRSLFDESSWTALPASLREEVTGVDFTAYIERVAEATAAGTIDARDERHLTWTGMTFDGVAWEEMIRRSEGLLRRAQGRAAEAVHRLVASGESPVAVTLGVACFESPDGATLTPMNRLEDFLDDPHGQPV